MLAWQSDHEVSMQRGETWEWWDGPGPVDTVLHEMAECKQYPEKIAIHLSHWVRKSETVVYERKRSVPTEAKERSKLDSGEMGEHSECGFGLRRALQSTGSKRRQQQQTGSSAGVSSQSGTDSGTQSPVIRCGFWRHTAVVWNKLLSTSMQPRL